LRVPEVEHAMRLADEPRAVDDVRVVLDDRLDELGILGRVVLEVGVLDDDDLAGGLAEPGAQRGALSLVAVVEDYLQVAVASLHLAEDLAGAVLRAVVDDDDLRADRDLADPAEDLVDGLLFVVAGDDDREDQVGWDAEDAQLAAEGLAQGLDQPLPALGVAG